MMNKTLLCAALLALTLPVCPANAASSIERSGGRLVGDAVYFETTDCAPLSASGRAVVYVNFDGGTIFYSDVDDATNNMSRLFSGEWPAYGTGEQRELVMGLLEEHWADFDVVVTDRRPGSGPYTMVMVGPEFIVPDGALGIAPVDCFDNNQANVVYGFLSVDDGLGPLAHAWTISHELGHSFGLEHVEPQNDVMYASLNQNAPSFLDDCHGIDSGEAGIGCSAQHEVSCPVSDQNSWQDLHELFGDYEIDEDPPEVWVQSPEDQAQLEPDTLLTVNVGAEDDTLVDVVEIKWIGEAPVELPPTGAPFRWTIEEGLPEGGYSFYALARDLAGNEATSEVINLGVGDVPPPDVDEIPDEPEPEDDDGTEGMGDDLGSSEAGGGQGCGCATVGSGSMPGWGLLGLLWLVRRRSSH